MGCDTDTLVKQTKTRWGEQFCQTFEGNLQLKLDHQKSPTSSCLDPRKSKKPTTELMKTTQLIKRRRHHHDPTPEQHEII